MSNLGVIIQARMCSSRMVNKILLPFSGSETILSIVVGKFDNYSLPIVVATTTNPKDDAIVDFCLKKGIKYFRGDESDVLDRFISCAKEFGFDEIIRVCSDNPFLDKGEIARLIDEIAQGRQTDYVSFQVNGVPSIKTHFGFWIEYVTLSALEKVARYTEEKLFHEHVTNYIYANADKFSISWIKADATTNNRNDIRLTIDTKDDFATVSQMYNCLIKANTPLTIANVIGYIDSHRDLVKKMKVQIEKNSK